MINVEGLRTVLAHVTDRPSEWHQEQWTRCFAGQTLRLLADATELGMCSEQCGSLCQGLEVDGEKLYGSNIGVRAALVLGLEPLQAHELFQGSNTLQDLSRLIEQFAAEEAERLSLAA
jgi:hypothetical protein